MQLQWLEDFCVLAHTRSFTQAAEACHVTRPAFGRRIQALQVWAGVELIVRGTSPVRLTSAGEDFLETAQSALRNLQGARDDMRKAAGRRASTLTLATGRTLARTVVADWLVRLDAKLSGSHVQVITRSLPETVLMLERNEVDFSCVYQHPALALRLDGRQFSYLTLAHDKLVPVARATVQGKPEHRFGLKPAPYLAYSKPLALGRLVEDFLTLNAEAPLLSQRLECDSPDALHEYAIKGLGIAWLPWSMVHADCKTNRLAVMGAPRHEIHFEVRIYRPKRRLSPLAEEVWQVFSKS